MKKDMNKLEKTLNKTLNQFNQPFLWNWFGVVVSLNQYIEN